MNKATIPLEERVIVALDVEDPRQAQTLVRQCESHTRYFKVGLQLFLASWFEIVDWLVARGHKVMLDLKFFDIPETVKLAIEEVNKRDVNLVTIHGNDPIIRAAVSVKKEVQLLAVTVLTSFGEEDMRAMGMTQSIEDLVAFRAQRALELGCDGIVSSGLEAQRMRSALGDKMLIVTPGIRPGANIGTTGDDQKRVVSAGAAVANGASHVVVGRPIIKAEDPAKVLGEMQQEIAAVLQHK
ncbi:MAG: orotidine-5'-phosphate decarboxylase [Deltaproteobacteria bacterium]|nr:MAG: orotidine-5'-phosphate decarboxylase [Desulfobacterales bacterium]PIE72488.1 MAG: orotidine-5'-phosphate decarboxylase [Deltaproteobacteria bacterium]